MATITCSNPTRAEVVAKIASASPGDTVVVPAGTASWAGDVTISGITLKGAGKTAAGTVITAGKVTLNKHAAQVTRLTGFRFTGNDMHASCVGSVTLKPFVVGECYFQTSGAVYMEVTGNGGLFHHCEFVSPTPTNQDLFIVRGAESSDQGAASWAAPHSMGTADASGDKNTYFEDCTWLNFLELTTDQDDGARVVYRRNIFTDSSITNHGGGAGSSGNDTSQFGCKHLEVYQCEFIRITNSFGVNKWVWWRGGTGVFARNIVPLADSPDGSSYTNKCEIFLTVGCPGAYPIAYQPGQVSTPADATPDRPILIFENTGLGTEDDKFIAIWENPNNPCATPLTYIVEGRDFFKSNQWGWVPYQYPHPLAAESSSGGGVDPARPPGSATYYSGRPVDSSLNTYYTGTEDFI